MAFNILIAEDEEITLRHLTHTLEKEGYEVAAVQDGLEARKALQAGEFDLLIADIKMPGMDGLELLALVKDKHQQTEVIIITGYGSIGSAIEAMKIGAYDYLTKPFDLDELLIKVEKIREHKAFLKQHAAYQVYFGQERQLGIIANSREMKQILEVIEGLRESNCNVLLTGESGVGKSLLAKAIHSTSRRRDMPFLSINCATLSEELLANELFGHEKGAFTGALTKKEGLVEIADTGSLFLDEVSEMSNALQAKLLTVIEEGRFFRLGGTRQIQVDVRFIAATNQDVNELLATRQFREDLYFRLNVMEIHIPPLRKRRADIEPLSSCFLEKHLPNTNKKITGFTPEAMEILKKYSFPGNVRELENLIERAIILEKGPRITPASLPQSLRVFQFETVEPGRIKTITELNRGYAEKVVESLDGNRTKAAKALGISRTSLWRLLNEPQ